jgi:hypothetical protein
MEETVAATRDRWPAADSATARWGLRLAPALITLFISVTLTVAALAFETPYVGWDTRAYYDALRSSDPYAGAAVGDIGSFLYPPPFLQVLGPAGQLPWPVFLFGWTTLLAAVVVGFLIRVPRRYRIAWPVLIVLGGADVWAGNINLLLAAGAIAGMTYPAAWAGLALTKVTPGIGALWLGFRGRWPEFGLAVLVTGILAALSFVAAPALWGDWLAIVFSESPNGPYATAFPVPLAIRLPLAIGLLWIAARSDRSWLVPIACMAALPVIWFNGLSMLVAAAALLPDGQRRAEPAPSVAPARPSA